MYVVTYKYVKGNVEVHLGKNQFGVCEINYITNTCEALLKSLRFLHEDFWELTVCFSFYVKIICD